MSSWQATITSPRRGARRGVDRAEPAAPDASSRVSDRRPVPSTRARWRHVVDGAAARSRGGGTAPRRRAAPPRRAARRPRRRRSGRRRAVDHAVVGHDQQPGRGRQRLAQLLGLGVDHRELLQPLAGGDAEACARSSRGRRRRRRSATGAARTPRPRPRSARPRGRRRRTSAPRWAATVSPEPCELPLVDEVTCTPAAPAGRTPSGAAATRRGSTSLSQNSALSSASVPGIREVKPTSPCGAGRQRRCRGRSSAGRRRRRDPGGAGLAARRAATERNGAAGRGGSSSSAPRPSTRKTTYDGAGGSSRPAGCVAERDCRGRAATAGTTSPSERSPYAGSTKPPGRRSPVVGPGGRERSANASSPPTASPPSAARRRAASSRRRRAHRCSRGRRRTGVGAAGRLEVDPAHAAPADGQHRLGRRRGAGRSGWRPSGSRRRTDRGSVTASVDVDV